MSAPNQSPWDATPPRRPGKDDFDGCALTDDDTDPPIAGEMPTAAQQNTLGFTHVSTGSMVPNATIGYTGGNPGAIASVVSAASAVTLMSSTISRTRNGPGDVSLTWPSGTFPAPVSPPKAFLNVAGGLGAHNYSISVVAITNGVRVTTTQDAVLTDLSFTVDVM